MDAENIRNHFYRMQVILSKMCVKYNAPAERALFQHRKDELQRVIQMEIDACSRYESTIHTMQDELERIDEIRNECHEQLSTFGENTVEHEAVKRRISYLENLPKKLRINKSFLTKRKKLVAKLQSLDPEQEIWEDIKNVAPYIGMLPTPDSILSGYFKYGYFPDVWQGIEHYLPDGI